MQMTVWGTLAPVSPPWKAVPFATQTAPSVSIRTSAAQTTAQVAAQVAAHADAAQAEVDQADTNQADTNQAAVQKTERSSSEWNTSGSRERTRQCGGMESPAHTAQRRHEPQMEDGSDDPDIADNEANAACRFFQRAKMEEIAFLEHWSIPVHEGLELLAFQGDVQWEEACAYLASSPHEKPLDALRRFLEDQSSVPCGDESYETEDLTPSVSSGEPAWEDFLVSNFSSADRAEVSSTIQYDVVPFEVPGASTKMYLRNQPAQLGRERQVLQRYDGLELSANGTSEGGYLALEVGEWVIPTDGDFAGHRRNRFETYFYGCVIDSNGYPKTGWFPPDVFFSAESNVCQFPHPVATEIR